MKQIAMRVMQKIIAFSLCIVLLLTNIGMIMPNKDNNTQISIQTEENHNVEVSQVKEDKKITTKGDIERKQRKCSFHGIDSYQQHRWRTACEHEEHQRNL